MPFVLYAIWVRNHARWIDYGAHLMHMPAHWIAVGAIRALGRADSVRGKCDAPERSFAMS
jgi:hypothetical protein